MHDDSFHLANNFARRINQSILKMDAFFYSIRHEIRWQNLNEWFNQKNGGEFPLNSINGNNWKCALEGTAFHFIMYLKPQMHSYIIHKHFVCIYFLALLTDFHWLLWVLLRKSTYSSNETFVSGWHSPRLWHHHICYLHTFESS